MVLLEKGVFVFKSIMFTDDDDPQNNLGYVIELNSPVISMIGYRPSDQGVIFGSDSFSLTLRRLMSYIYIWSTHS